MGCHADGGNPNQRNRSSSRWTGRPDDRHDADGCRQHADDGYAARPSGCGTGAHARRHADGQQFDANGRGCCPDERTARESWRWPIPVMNDRIKDAWGWHVQSLRLRVAGLTYGHYFSEHCTQNSFLAYYSRTPTVRIHIYDLVIYE